MLTVWVIGVGCAVVAGVRAHRDLRRLGNALWALGAVALAAAGLLDLLVDSIAIDDRWLLISLVAVVGATSVVLSSGYLFVSGTVLLTRNFRNPAAWAALMLGLVLTAYATAWIYVLETDTGRLATALAVLLPAILFVTGTFAAFLVYGVAYERHTRSLGAEATYIVVLGSHLSGNHLTPELAGRLETALHIRNRALDRGGRPLLVLSGGRARETGRAEAAVMAHFLAARGVPRSDMRLEKRSSSTAENLTMSRDVLAREGRDGKGVVVTSSFHAFRAAVLMRRVGLTGQAVGARTSLWVWPTAVLREYVATMRDQARATVVVGALCALPVMWWIADPLVPGLTS